jgi:F-type H+-transporting ATPase subunit b
LLVCTVACGAEPGAEDEATAGAGTSAAEDAGHGDGEHASHGNTHPLSADPDLAIFTAIIFGLMLLILGKFAWGPIRQALDDRENYVATQLDEARQRHEDAQRLLKEHEQKLAGATDEVRALLDQARKEADMEKQAILGEALKAATAEKERAVREIGAAKNEALQELADKSVGTAVDLAGRIVGRQLDSKDHANLIEDALKQFTNKN